MITHTEYFKLKKQEIKCSSCKKIIQDKYYIKKICCINEGDQHVELNNTREGIGEKQL